MKMKNSYGKLQAFVKSVINSIVFIPSIVSIAAFLLGIIILSFEAPFLQNVFSSVPLIQVNEIGTLRAILTSFLTGIISILIFSFSMLMILLNQTASQYSPRILSWLIGKRANQWVLGIYLGTLIFTLLLLLNLPRNTDFRPLYNFGILVNALLVFISIVLFVSIINNVSRDLQISNIISDIYKQTLKRMAQETTNATEKELDQLADTGWLPYPAEEPGYLQNIGQERLVSIASRYDVCIKIHFHVGYYYMKGDPLFYIRQKQVGTELKKEIGAHFVFYQGERIQDNSYYGFKQLSEIAVKALSPGINDPRTANSCIDYLTDLFAIWMCKKDTRYLRDDKGIIRLLIYPPSFTDLVNISLMPILTYAKNDINILQSLLVMLRKLAQADKERRYQQELNLFFAGLLTEMDRHKSNAYYYTYLKKYIGQLKLADGYYDENSFKINENEKTS